MTMICKNCGGDINIHRSDTDQCPHGGVDQTGNREEHWMSTVYEIADDSVARIAELEAENKKLRHICNLLNEDLYSWAAVELSENSQSCAWKSSMDLCRHARVLLSPKTGTNA